MRLGWPAIARFRSSCGPGGQKEWPGPNTAAHRPHMSLSGGVARCWVSLTLGCKHCGAASGARRMRVNDVHVVQGVHGD